MVTRTQKHQIILLLKMNFKVNDSEVINFHNYSMIVEIHSKLKNGSEKLIIGNKKYA